MSPKNIALFASGTGSNARKIIDYFNDNPQVNCQLLVSNKAEAPALSMATERGLATHLIGRKDFKEPAELLKLLEVAKIDLIVLAGFLWLMPKELVQAYPDRILNIHPALLPKYGGKGMYGMFVHQAVKRNKETESGITIHYVNERYDEGNIIFQASCPLSPEDSPERIAQKVQELEHLHFAPEIEKILLKMA